MGADAGVPVMDMLSSVGPPQLWRMYDDSGGTNLFAQRHTLHRVHHASKVVGLKLRVLDAFLRPILMQPGHAVLCALEAQQLIANTLLDEDAACMLIDDRSLVLFECQSRVLDHLRKILTAVMAFSTFSASPGFAASPFARIF